MSTLLSALPEGFPEEIITKKYFLEDLGAPAAIWAVRILGVLIFTGIIIWWIYLENKNKPEDK